jgi:hypothetical protein
MQRGSPPAPPEAPRFLRLPVRPGGRMLLGERALWLAWKRCSTSRR